jgi:hypothetical protein
MGFWVSLALTPLGSQGRGSFPAPCLRDSVSKSIG